MSSDSLFSTELGSEPSFTSPTKEQFLKEVYPFFFENLTSTNWIKQSALDLVSSKANAIIKGFGDLMLKPAVQAWKCKEEEYYELNVNLLCSLFSNMSTSRGVLLAGFELENLLNSRNEEDFTQKMTVLRRNKGANFLDAPILFAPVHVANVENQKNHFALARIQTVDKTLHIYTTRKQTPKLTTAYRAFKDKVEKVLGQVRYSVAISVDETEFLGQGLCGPLTATFGLYHVSGKTLKAKKLIQTFKTRERFCNFFMALGLCQMNYSEFKKLFNVSVPVPVAVEDVVQSDEGEPEEEVRPPTPNEVKMRILPLFFTNVPEEEGWIRQSGIDLMQSKKEEILKWAEEYAEDSGHDPKHWTTTGYTEFNVNALCDIIQYMSTGGNVLLSMFDFNTLSDSVHGIWRQLPDFLEQKNVTQNPVRLIIPVIEPHFSLAIVNLNTKIVTIFTTQEYDEQNYSTLLQKLNVGNNEFKLSQRPKVHLQNQLRWKENNSSQQFNIGGPLIMFHALFFINSLQAEPLHVNVRFKNPEQLCLFFEALGLCALDYNSARKMFDLKPRVTYNPRVTGTGTATTQPQPVIAKRPATAAVAAQAEVEPEEQKVTLQDLPIRNPTIEQIKLRILPLFFTNFPSENNWIRPKAMELVTSRKDALLESLSKVAIEYDVSENAWNLMSPYTDLHVNALCDIIQQMTKSQTVLFSLTDLDNALNSILGFEVAFSIILEEKNLPATPSRLVAPVKIGDNYGLVNIDFNRKEILIYVTFPIGSQEVDFLEQWKKGQNNDTFSTFIVSNLSNKLQWQETGAAMTNLSGPLVMFQALYLVSDLEVTASTVTSVFKSSEQLCLFFAALAFCDLDYNAAKEFFNLSIKTTYRPQTRQVPITKPTSTPVAVAVPDAAEEQESEIQLNNTQREPRIDEILGLKRQREYKPIQETSTSTESSSEPPPHAGTPARAPNLLTQDDINNELLKYEDSKARWEQNIIPKKEFLIFRPTKKGESISIDRKQLNLMLANVEFKTTVNDGLKKVEVSSYLFNLDPLSKTTWFNDEDYLSDNIDILCYAIEGLNLYLKTQYKQPKTTVLFNTVEASTFMEGNRNIFKKLLEYRGITHENYENLILLLPAHVKTQKMISNPNHYGLLHVNVGKRIVYILDSLKHTEEKANFTKKEITAYRNALKDRYTLYINKLNQVFPAKAKFQIRIVEQSYEQEGNDCGPVTMMNALFLSIGKPAPDVKKFFQNSKQIRVYLASLALTFLDPDFDLSKELKIKKPTKPSESKAGESTEKRKKAQSATIEHATVDKQFIIPTKRFESLTNAIVRHEQYNLHMRLSKDNLCISANALKFLQRMSEQYLLNLVTEAVEVQKIANGKKKTLTDQDIQFVYDTKTPLDSPFSL